MDVSTSYYADDYTKLTIQVFYAYTYGTAAWMVVQAVPLIVSPKFLVAMLSPEVKESTRRHWCSVWIPSYTDAAIQALEEYFARALGMSLITISVLCILLTGSVPLTSSLSDGITSEDEDPKAAYAVPTLTVTTLYHTGCAFYCYTLWNRSGLTGFVLGVGGSALLATIGGWCILFASSDGKISKRTGADKRTSGFPFKNKEADRKKVR